MRAVFLVGLCVLAGGCALWGGGARISRAIPPHPELQRTLGLIERAEKEPLAREHFKAELDKARAAWSAAVAVWNDERGSVDEDDDEWQEIVHFNHVARQRANLVLVKTRGLAARREIAALRRPGGAAAPSQPSREPAIEPAPIPVAIPEILQKRLRPRQDERGLVLTLHDDYFAPGSAELRGGEAELDALVSFLVANPLRAVACEGHTDVEGGEAENQKLSQQRARRVQQALLERGLEFTRVTAVGYGSQAQPGRNGRRVEIVIGEPAAPRDAWD